MNLTSTTNQPQSGIDQLAGRTPGLRTIGASDAQGFAQMLQAFEHEPESLVTKEVRLSDEKPDDQTQGLKDEPAVAEPDETGDESASAETADASKADQTEPTHDDTQASDDQGGHGDPGTQPALEGATVGEPAPQQNRDPSTTPPQQASENQPATGEADRESPSQQREASLRLLSNQSEQAKLSIKGLVRSLTVSTGADATKIAVDTRLGHDEANTSPPFDKQTAADPAPKQSQPRPSTPTPTQDHPATQHTVASQPSRAPDGAVSHLPFTPRETAIPVDADPDQARTDVQQARSTRADAGVATQPTRAATPLDATRLAQLGTAGQVARTIRDGSAQSVRAVTGADSAQVGSQLKDASASPGSLVEKMGTAPDAKGADRTAVLAQVQRGLASLLRSGKGDMTLKLTPASLGEIKIRIKSQGVRLSVRFETTSDEASDLLNASTKDLSAHLRTKGVHVEHLSVERRDAAHDTAPTNQNNTGAQGDPHAGHDHQPRAHDHPAPGRESSAPVDQPERYDDSETSQPDTIWTELGLDAIA